MLRSAVFAALGVGVLLILFSPRASADLWDPFAGVPEQRSLLTEVQNLLRGLLDQIQAIVGRPVSSFRIPDRFQIGFRPRAFYQPPIGSPAVSYPPLGFRSRGTPPTPLPGDCLGEQCHDLAGFEPDTLEQQDFGHDHTPTPEP